MKTIYSLMVLLLSLGINQMHAQNAGNALSLDGTDDYAAPITPNVSGMNEGTIGFWFAPNSWSTSTSIWNGGNGHPGVTGDWAKIGSHSSAGDQNLVFGAYAGSWRWSNSGELPVISIWNHVAATWDSSGFKIYINGELRGTNGYSGGIPNYSVELIGTSTYGAYLYGHIDEVRIWSIARNSTQIISTLLDTLSSDYYSTSDSGLIAYYRMDSLEDLGINGDGADDLRDLSVNGNHLDTYGNPLLSQSGAFIITGVEQFENNIPNQYLLNQNYPNPFNPSTKINFQIQQNGFTSLKVFDILGNEVASLVNEFKPAGTYEIKFDASGLASGIYFYRIQAGSFVELKKMILMK